MPATAQLSQERSLLDPGLAVMTHSCQGAHTHTDTHVIIVIEIYSKYSAPALHQGDSKLWS